MQQQRRPNTGGPSAPGEIPISDEGGQKQRQAPSFTGVVDEFEQITHDAAVACQEAEEEVEEEEEEEEDDEDQKEDSDQAEGSGKKKRRKADRYICYCGNPSCTIGFREGRQEPSEKGIRDRNGNIITEDDESAF